MGQHLSGELVLRRFRKVVAVSSPAAGADWSVTVPGGERWRIQAILATLTTAVAAATRVPILELMLDNQKAVRIAPANSQAASLTNVYQWFPNADVVSVGGFDTVAIPDVLLEPGDTIDTSTVAIQAADQWSGILVAVTYELVAAGPIELDHEAEPVIIAGIEPGA